MPEVIADTSVIQYLYQSGSLEVLQKLYGTVIVPEGVAEEIAAGRALGHVLPDLSTVRWIRIEAVAQRRLLLLAVGLGKGEREVLSLAVERPEATAILDDSLARKMAKHLGVPFTGTLGVLLRAKAAGHLEAVKPLLARIEGLGFRLDGATRTSILALAGEG